MSEAAASPQRDHAGRDAIEIALAAERRARTSVATAQADAHEHLQAARHHAQAIGERVAVRVRRAQRAADARAARQVADIQAAAARQAATAQPYPRERIVDAARDLAARLTADDGDRR